MNIRTLAWKNLSRRASRATFTGLGIFLGIGTFVALTLLTTQMEGAVQDKLDRYGANILVTPKAEQLELGFGDMSLGGTQVARTSLSMADRDRIASIPMKDKLAKVVPFLLHAGEASGIPLVWMGLPSVDLSAARPWWKTGGVAVFAPGEVLLGSEAAARLDKGAGGTIDAGGKTYRIAGVLVPTGEKEDAMVIADISDVQKLAGKSGAVAFIEVAAHCKDCPVDEIVTEISQALPEAKVSAIRQVVESRKAMVQQFRRMGMGVSAVVLAIAGLMVFVTVMGGVRERTREIGVLRAVGFRKRSVLTLLFWETGWIALLSSLTGAVVGIAVSAAAGPLFGIERFTLHLLPVAGGILMGVALGLMGSWPPARRAASLSPTEAIRSL
jgi:putative ABC transport system permease protein